MSDHIPVDGIHVTQSLVLLQSDSASEDGRQTGQSDVLQLLHLKCDQRIVEEELLSSDHRQVWKDLAHTLKTHDSVQQQVARDLS